MCVPWESNPQPFAVLTQCSTTEPQEHTLSTVWIVDNSLSTVVNIHLEQWAANAAAPGEQLGVRCLAQGSHLSRGIEGGESAGYSLPPPTIPAGPEIRTHDLRVTSPTLYPLGHDCPNNDNNNNFILFFCGRASENVGRASETFNHWLFFFSLILFLMYFYFYCYHCTYFSLLNMYPFLCKAL